MASSHCIAELAQALWEAKDRGGSKEIPDKLERLEITEELLQDRPLPSEHPGLANRENEESADLLTALEAASIRPKLGDMLKSVSPQQVEQWIRDIEGVFAIAAITPDVLTRTLWAIRTISYHIRGELLRERFKDGPPKGWAWVKSEERDLIQDLLPRSFFKSPTGEDDDEVKIAFVWAKVPDVMQRRMQQHRGFRDITTWADFGKSLGNAESATRSTAPESTC